MDSIIGNTRRPDITFYPSGRIDITSYISRLLDLHDGDVVDVGCMGKEFYLYKRFSNDDIVGRHEGRCFASNKGGRNLRLNSIRLCNAILAECNTSCKVQLAVGEPVVIENIGLVVPLITRHNLYATRN